MEQGIVGVDGYGGGVWNCGSFAFGDVGQVSVSRRKVKIGCGLFLDDHAITFK